MNASQFMDKQIMDLASSTNAQPQSKDFIDIMKPPEEDHHQGCGSQSSNGVDEIDALRAEEIVPSYDFQPIRPVPAGISSPKSLSFDGGSSARAWNSLDSKTNTNGPIRNYGSLDSIEPAEVIPEKDQHARDASVVSEIDHTIKKHVDNVLHALEAVSARLTQLESRTRNLENSVDDLKVASGNNYGITEGKMRQLENMLREVQNGVQVIKDKQELMEGQFQLTKLQISKPDQPQESHNPAHVDSMQPPPPSLPQQPHTIQQPPPPSSAPYQQSVPSLPLTMAPPPPASQQILPHPVPMPNQFPHLPNPSVPQREPYMPPPPSQPQEVSNRQYQLPPSQPPPPPAAQQHQQYQPPQQPPYSQPMLPPQHPQQLQPTPGHHPEEPPYMQYPPPGLHQPPPSQPPLSGASPTQQLYGSAPHMYEAPPGRSSLGFSSDPYPYGGPPQYGSNSPVKPQQHSQSSSGGGYPQLPTARVLPQALPTASGINNRSESSGTGNRVPVDDVVDKVTTMGFPRDQVRATVRKLTENGQAVDLNIVLDKLMNDSDVQPPRGYGMNVVV